MKTERNNRIGSFIMVFISLMLAFSCTLDKKDSDNKAVTENEVEREQVVEQEKIYAQTDSLPDSSFLFDSLNIDLDKDGTNETISLFVDAARHENRVMWEDGHQWWLTVEFDSGTFVLFNEFIPFGTAKFWVVEEDNYHILILSDSPHFLELISYQMLQDEDAFMRHSALELQGTVKYRTPERLFQ